jgi:hypothetical protein
MRRVLRGISRRSRRFTRWLRAAAFTCARAASLSGSATQSRAARGATGGHATLRDRDSAARRRIIIIDATDIAVGAAAVARSGAFATSAAR